MRSSQKAKDAYVLAWISLVMNLTIAIYLILITLK